MEARLANVDYLGWRFILEPLRGQRLLWFEVPENDVVALLSACVGELVVLGRGTRNSGAIGVRADEGNVKRVKLDESCGWRLPFPDEYFDGTVIANLSWLSEPADNPKIAVVKPQVSWLFAELHRVVKEGGYLYATLPNSCHFANLRRRLLPGAAANCTQAMDYPSAARLAKALKWAGFEGTETYPMLSSAGVIEEVLVGGPYRPTKNAFAFKQKLKAVLLNSRLAGFFTPSLGILATKGARCRAFLDHLLGKLRDDRAIFPEIELQLAVRRYLVLPGKVILSVGDVSRPYGGRIVILPLVATVRDRLRDEAWTLAAIHATGLSIKSMVPAFFGEFELEGQAYFVQQELPGTSVDISAAALDRMTTRAASLLTEFHLQTARDTIADDGVIAELLFEPLARILDALGPACSYSLARIGELAGGALRGRLFKTVWMHGDFKIENLLFDPDDLRVTGVIDWDLARRNGFPLGDMLYLVAYNRVIREGGEVEEFILDVLIPRRLSEEEVTLLRVYMTALDLDDDFFDLLIVMFCIHHLAYRRDAQRCLATTIAKMQSVLSAAERMLACKYDSGSLQ